MHHRILLARSSPRGTDKSFLFLLFLRPLQISEAYRRYGITPETTNIIVIKILFPTADKPQPPTAEDVCAHLSQHVEGTAVPLTNEEIAKTTDWTKVKKYYKLNGAPALNTIKEDAARLKESEMLVLSSMALRGV